MLLQEQLKCSPLGVCFQRLFFVQAFFWVYFLILFSESIFRVYVLSLFLCMFSDSIFQCADRCSHHFREFSSQQYFQILRVFYVQTPTTSKSQKHHVINCMTFTPVQTTLGPNINAEFEKMRHTLIRISSWLELAGNKIDF